MKKILLLCSAGMSTSMVVNKMKHAAMQKGIATEYLLSILREKHGVRPVIGLGDSLSDYKFLQHCSWWGVPKKSQFASHINLSLNHEIKSTDI
mgnify:CR=1 FL=1